jgi:hypothetical protein
LRRYHICDAFLEAYVLASYDEATKYINAIVLGYDSIHVCKRNCVPFHGKKLSKADVCPVYCEADSRWKDVDNMKCIAYKVFRHFL